MFMQLANKNIAITLFMYSEYVKKQKMYTVADLPTLILASLFAAVMFTGIHDQLPLLTIVHWFVCAL